MRCQAPHSPRPFLLASSLLLLAGLGCGLIGFVENPAGLTGPVYWAAATGVPLPTVTVFLGTTTPVYADTPVPQLVTTTPEWTTVTATPIAPPPTETPAGFVATPFSVTTTPLTITTTSPPPVTTTPGLPLIGFSTPEPLETPYYRVGTFYMYSDVYVGGPEGPVVRLTGHDTQPSPRDPAATYHYFTLLVTNYRDTDLLLPAADLFFLRHITQDGVRLTGRWLPQNEPLLARGLPSYEAQQLPPLASDEQRELVLAFVVPNGEVTEAGLVTHWAQPLEGGRPVWFYLEADTLGPFIDAHQPPPPTPAVLDDGWPGSGGEEPGDGTGMWPTTGLVTRGFGCSAFYTGIDGAGFGCPQEQPWFHNGVDIANSTGTLIWSPLEAVMAYAGPNPTGADCSDLPGAQPPTNGLGNYQRLEGQGMVHYFGHLSGFLVTDGPVTAGQNVAEMGSTGCSTGPHLHWTLYQFGSLVDPAEWAGPGPQP